MQGKCGFNTNASLFFAQSSFYIDSIWFRHFAETRLCPLQLSILTNVYLSCLPCPRQLNRYLVLQLMASSSAAGCWCGVIWIWRYQRHCTACDNTDSAFDAPAHLLWPVHQRPSCSQVSTHWCFYDMTCEREVGYKRLMIGCCRSLLWNSDWWQDNNDGDIYAADAEPNN